MKKNKIYFIIYNTHFSQNSISLHNKFLHSTVVNGILLVSILLFMKNHKPGYKQQTPAPLVVLCSAVCLKPLFFTLLYLK